MSETPWAFGSFSALAGGGAGAAPRPATSRRTGVDPAPRPGPADHRGGTHPTATAADLPSPTTAPTPRVVGCCGPSARAPLARDAAESTAALLKAVADPARLQLLSLVRAADDGEACVCDLTAAVGLSQPTVSHHLKVLVEAGLLERERRGVWAWYRLVPARLADVAAIFS